MTVATTLPPLYNISRKREAPRPLDLRASFGANDVTRTHDLLITNQLLYRLSYISLSIHDMVFLERHIQNRIYFIIFFDGRQQILLISCHTLCMAIPVYYILYFEGIPSKYFQAISLFPTLFPRIPPITTGNSVVIFPRNFDKFCHYFLLTPFFLQSSVLFSIYIIYLIISFYKELFTFSTEFSTFNLRSPHGLWKERPIPTFPRSIHNTFTTPWKPKPPHSDKAFRGFPQVPHPLLRLLQQVQ